MQKAYQALRVISEAQTVHIVLNAQPRDLMFTELINTSEGLRANSDDGIKAVILDFVNQAEEQNSGESIDFDLLARAREAVKQIPQPVLVVVRANLSGEASRLIEEGDFTLMAYEASLLLPEARDETRHESEVNRIGGRSAERLGKVTWAASADDLNRKMESILDRLRSRSAVALRAAKTAARLGQQTSLPALEILHQVNEFYLHNTLQTEDAREGVRAFLEKRQPRWKNR